MNEVEETVLGRPTNYRLFFDNVQKAEDFLLSTKKEILCESQVEECETQDWNAEWKKHYSPIKVNEHLEIVPSWMTDYQSDIQEKIFIYPGMGFGTGSHETTYLCLKLFTEEVKEKNISSLLDFGSGSGILGLAALKFFPDAQIDFYDIDLEANKNCFQNAELNHLQDKSFRLLLPEVREALKSEYDVVFANILESILILEKEALISYTKNGGYLILSGLLKHQLDGIVNTYTNLGMTLTRRLEKGDWGALLFRKQM